MVTLVTVVWCASCGSNKNNALSGDGNGTDGGGSGDDATCSGFNCSSSSSGGGDGGFANNGEGGVPVVTPVNGPVNDTNCPNGTAASISGGLLERRDDQVAVPVQRHGLPGRPRRSRSCSGARRGTPDGVYLHLSSQKYDCKGCYKGVEPPAGLRSPTARNGRPPTRKAAARATRSTVELITSSGGTLSMAKETWTFAKGSLAGDVYYNTYDSKIVPGQAAGGTARSSRSGTARPRRSSTRRPARAPRAMRLVPLAVVERVDARRAAALLSGRVERPRQHVLRSHEDADAQHHRAGRRDARWTTGACRRFTPTGASCSPTGSPPTRTPSRSRVPRVA